VGGGGFFPFLGEHGKCFPTPFPFVFQKLTGACTNIPLIHRFFSPPPSDTMALPLQAGFAGSDFPFRKTTFSPRTCCPSFPFFPPTPWQGTSFFFTLHIKFQPPCFPLLTYCSFFPGGHGRPGPPPQFHFTLTRSPRSPLHKNFPVTTGVAFPWPHLSF